MIPESIATSVHGPRQDVGEPTRDKYNCREHDIDIQPEKESSNYHLDEQVGYLLRLANQRHLEIFSTELPTLTPTQLSVLARLLEYDDISQNELGRRVGIDAATTNGVIERLSRKHLVKTQTDSRDKRRLCISLTDTGRQAIHEAIPIARTITQLTLQQLDAKEAEQFITLLRKLLPPPESAA